MTTETVSYEELARRVGDMVMFNNHNVYNDEWAYELIETPLLRQMLDERDRENGIADDDEEAERSTVFDIDIYQTYHITPFGAEYLMNHTSQLVSYDEALDAWLWHISHFGTAWSGVHTIVYDFDFNEREYISANDYKKYQVG